jgi:hypothetical protein
VADSNRRKRFCRPLPSHSVNRPYSVLLKELQKQFKPFIGGGLLIPINRASRAPSLHSVGSNRRKLFCRPLPSHTVNRPYSVLLKELQKTIQTTHRWRIARPDKSGLASSFTSFSRFEPPSLTTVSANWRRRR